MSRIRGIDVRLQLGNTLTKHRNAHDAKRRGDRSSKDDVEKQQIQELVHKLPKLDLIFNIHRKVGEGMFSSVYLGSLKQHVGLPDKEKRWFAIKHLVPTSHPARVEHELRCLQEMGGRNNVIGVELCLRHLDTIVFVMPYIPHRKFSEYVGDMDAEELRCYLRALLEALRHVHSFGVIHRDVKPSNFLYDRENRRYLLVDFGLAQRITSVPESTRVSVARPALAAAPPVRALPPPPPAHSSSIVTKRRREEHEESPACAKRQALDLTVPSKQRAAAAAADAPAPLVAPPVAPPAHKWGGSLGGGGGGGVAGTAVSVRSTLGECLCAGAGAVCSACGLRPAPRAPRAGTQGFRPPEVLLKYPHQTTAVDMWACGVVAGSVLCGRYPLFRAPDDAAALAELAALLGTQPLHRAAASLGRRLVTSMSRRGFCLRKFSAKLRGGSIVRPAAANGGGATNEAPTTVSWAISDEDAEISVDEADCEHCYQRMAKCICRDHSVPADSFTAGVQIAGFPEAAFALAARLLEPDPRRRITAAQALAHPFLTTPLPRT